MLRDEGVSLIKQILGFRTTGDATIVTNMQFCQTRLEAGPIRPRFLISEDSFTSTVASEPRIEVPSDFLAEVDQAVLKFRPDTWPDDPEVALKKDMYDVLFENFRGAVNGVPKAYALVGNYFYLFPTPDTVYNIRMIYYQKDLVLSSNFENGWMKHNPLVLLGKTGKMIAGSLRDAAALSIFDEWEKEGLLLLESQTVEADMANLDAQVGGDH